MYIIADIYFNGDGTDIDYIKAVEKCNTGAMLKYKNCLYSKEKEWKKNKVDSYKN